MIGRKTSFIILLLLVTGCGKAWDWEHPITPLYNKINGNELPAGFSASARQGWDDGCKAGYAVYGDHMYKAIYGWHRDTTKIGDHAYESNWNDGYHYCRQSANTNINQDTLW